MIVSSGRGRDSGSASLELVLLAPVLVLGLLLVVWCGRLAEARGAVALAAGQAARAGSMAAQHRMLATARTVAADTLRLNGSPCGGLGVSAALRYHDDGGVRAASVEAVVACTSTGRDVAVFGSRTTAARSQAPIDRYRAA